MGEKKKRTVTMRLVADVGRYVVGMREAQRRLDERGK